VISGPADLNFLRVPSGLNATNVASALSPLIIENSFQLTAMPLLKQIAMTAMRFSSSLSPGQSQCVLELGYVLRQTELIDPAQQSGLSRLVEAHVQGWQGRLPCGRAIP
jgi:hypothetical protein